MSTAATKTSASSTSSLAASTAFRTFATVFAITAPILYVICEMANWPLFTYHPGTNRIVFGWAPAVRDEGPAMYLDGEHVDRRRAPRPCRHRSPGPRHEPDTPGARVDRSLGGDS